MEERDHYLSRQYHQQLLKIAADERLARKIAKNSPGRLDQLLDWSGDVLISLGQGLKSHATIPELSEECA